MDTVHQGDLEAVKGVYHINAVDEVTQWQVMGAATQIGEQWLIPVLEVILAQFPFRIRSFHSDNESEFINHTVARLLNKLLAEQTKSRPRDPNDNGLVESKNGAIIRKHMGMATSRRATPPPCCSSIAITSTRISTSIGPAGYRKPAPTGKGNNGGFTVATPRLGNCCGRSPSSLPV